MVGLANLLGVLQNVVKRAWLQGILPEEHRPAVPKWYAFTLLLLFAIVPPLMMAWHRKGPTGLLVMTALVIGSAFALFILMAVAAFISAAREWKRGLARPVRISRSFASRLAYVVLFGYPGLLYVLVALYLWSWKLACLSAGIYLAGLLLAVIAFSQAYGVHILMGFVRAVLATGFMAATSSVTLLPLLLMVIVLSVFSKGLWDIAENLTALRLIGAGLIITIPGAVLLLLSLKKDAANLLGEFPPVRAQIDTARRSSALQAELKRGLISPEEWDTLEDDMSWRPVAELQRMVDPALGRRIRLWLLLVSVASYIGLTLSAFFFLTLFLQTLIPLGVISLWTAATTPLGPAMLCDQWLGGTPPIGLAIPLVIIKTSLLLSTILGATCLVNMQRDPELKKRTTDWLGSKAAEWRSFCALYVSLAMPGYHRLSRTIRGGTLKSVFISLVTRPGSTEDEVRTACADALSRETGHARRVVITAYEMKEGVAEYSISTVGKKWQLVRESPTREPTFNVLPETWDGTRDLHLEGYWSLRQDGRAPHGWFGDTDETQAVGNAIWSADPDHLLVMHPYAASKDRNVFVTVHLTRRMRTSGEYRKTVAVAVSATLRSMPRAALLYIDIQFRDTDEKLASFTWVRDAEDVTYKDEKSSRTSYERPDQWGLPKKESPVPGASGT